MISSVYKYIFWSGYCIVLVITFIPLTGDLTNIAFGTPSFKFRLDHLLHFLAYFLICLYFLFGLWKGIVLFRKKPLGKFILVTVILASVTEFVQLWVPTRAFNILDWVANVSGILCGLAVIKITDRRLKKEDSNSD